MARLKPCPTSHLIGVSGPSPAKTPRTLRTARSAIAVRVSRVRFPRCGAWTSPKSETGGRRFPLEDGEGAPE